VKRTLTLKRETLVELTGTQLTSVIGAAARITVNGITCPLTYCPEMTGTETYQCTQTTG
jgi:hypothetical protein